MLFFIIHNCNAQLFSKKRVLNNENFDKPALSWGYFLGMNNYDYNFDYVSDTYDIQTEKTFGFNVGLIGNFRISDYFDLRFEPGLVMSNRNLLYNPLSFNQTEFQENLHKREIKSTYIHFPLILKVSAKRLNNFKPYVLAGISTAINLSSKENSVNDNSLGQFRTKGNVFFYELGFGVDFYLEWFKFSPSIRGVFALSDEHVPDNDLASPWTNNIEFMKTSGILINFTFQYAIGRLNRRAQRPSAYVSLNQRHTLAVDSANFARSLANSQLCNGVKRDRRFVSGIHGQLPDVRDLLPILFGQTHHDRYSAVTAIEARCFGSLHHIAHLLGDRVDIQSMPNDLLSVVSNLHLRCAAAQRRLDVRQLRLFREQRRGLIGVLLKLR